MKKIILSALISSSFISGFAFADPEVTLKLHHFLPPMSMAHQQFLQPWANKVEADSDGRIKVELYPAMQLGGKAPQLYDQARKGIVDVIWTVGGYTPGRFPKTTVFELPFMPGSAKATSMAVQEYAETIAKDEFSDVHLLSLFTHSPGSLHSRNKPIQTLEDLKGLKLRAPNKIMAEGFAENGANTIFMPVTEMPSALSKGVLDVAALPYEVVLPLKIYEMVKYHTEIKGERGLYANFNIFAMNKVRYESLPDDLKEVIDNNSGVSYSGHLGTLWDNYEITAREYAVNNGNEFFYIEGNEYDRWVGAFKGERDKWIEDMNVEDYDSTSLIDQAEKLIKKYEAME